MSDSVRPHGRQHTRLPRPWDSPGKNTGVGCHFLLQCMKVKLLSRVWLLATPWTAAYEAPPSMGFSRQEYWSGVPSPSPEPAAYSSFFWNPDILNFPNLFFSQPVFLIHFFLRLPSEPFSYLPPTCFFFCSSLSMNSVAAAVEVLEVSPSQNSLPLVFVSLGGISVSPLSVQLQTGKSRSYIPFLQNDFHPKSPSSGKF